MKPYVKKSNPKNRPKVYTPQLKDIRLAAKTLKDVSTITPLLPNQRYSKELNANILLKREDLQLVRSYKIRGAFNKMNALTVVQREKGVVCASAGNHSQGVAYSCRELKIRGTIYMPPLHQNKKLNR